MKYFLMISEKYIVRLIFLSLLLLLFLGTGDIFGQEPPPRPIKVTVTAQGLSFGTFTQGAAGGTVTVNELGVRSWSGDIILLSLNPLHSTALFEIEGNPGTMVTLLNGPDVVLNGSNGGSITLHIGSSSPASPFVITTVPPLTTLLNIGGVLTVGSPAANPPGNYSGTFSITFIQE